MKKERKLKLEVNKVSISKLNNISGGGDPAVTIASVVLCELTTLCDTDMDGDCKTYITALGTLDRC